jgi:hypothetical protein
MDRCRTFTAVHHDDFEEVAGTIGADDQVANWVVGHFLDDNGMANRVVDVSFVDAVPQRGGQHIHTSVLYYETTPQGWTKARTVQ